MEVALRTLSAYPSFETLILTLSKNPLLGILVGVISTGIVQSSSATTGILIAMAGSGTIPLDAAIPILFGTNIGTCVTAILSSIGTSKVARKAALFHLTFNLIGTILFTIVLVPFTKLVLLVSGDASIKRQIANAHTIFNVTNTLLLVWFIPSLIRFVNKLIPGDDKYVVKETKYIDERLLETPPIAVQQVVKEIIGMADAAMQNLELSMKAFKNNDLNLIKRVFENEHTINILESEIASFLAKLSNKELTVEDSKLITSMYHVVNDIERIGDHAENLAELSQEKIARRLAFSDDAVTELDDIFSYTLEALNISIESFIKNDKNKAKSVLKIEDRIDKLEKELRDTHIKRLNSGLCTAYSGTVFLDMISNLERVADHAVNIAESVYNR
jgi:phosphate:Na+ symporter